MSIDATVPVYPPLTLAYGNVVTVQPSDSTKKIEVWRAPDNGSGAPNDGASVVCATLPPSPLGGVVFADLLPNDGAKRYYKSRHFDDSTNYSTFTAYSDGLIPALLTNTLNVGPMAAFGAIVDALTGTKYELRFASTYLDPDTIDGLQSFIDFPASTWFMRLGQTPKAITSSTNASPISVQVTGHGYTTGDVVTIRGHTVNTAANGSWTITVVDANNFTLNTSTGNGVGGATGHVVRLSMTVDANGNLTSYGALQTRVLKVFDQNNAVIMDIESGKRILAIPVQPSVNSGTSLSIDLSTGLTQQVLLTGTCTITLNNPTDGGRFRIWFQQDTTGSRPFPTIVDGSGNALVLFSGGTAPTLTTTPGAMDLFEFEYRVNPTKRYTCITLQTNVLLPTPGMLGITATSTGTGFATTSTTHSVSMPASTTAGQLLVVVIQFQTGLGTSNTPAGWTQSLAPSGTTPTSVFTRVADGTEGGTTVNFTTTNAVAAIAHCYQINNWFGTIATGVNITTAASTNDPPANTPSWATDRSLWLAIAVANNSPSAAVTVSTYPTSYVNTTFATNTPDMTIAGCSRNNYAATENPSTYVWNTSPSFNNAMTIAIRPPG